MSESTAPQWPPHDPDLSTRQQTRSSLGFKPYWPRGALALGGLLTILSTFLGWLSFPIVGSLSLWKLSEVVNGLAGAVGSLDQSFGAPNQSGVDSLQQAGLGLSLLPWGVLVLGLPAAALAVILSDPRTVRRAAGAFGSTITACGLFGVIVIGIATSGNPIVGIGSGPIIMLVAGLLVLSGVAVNTDHPTRKLLATGGARDDDKVTKDATTGAYGLGGLGVLLIIVGLILLLSADGASANTSASTELDGSTQAPLQDDGWLSTPSPNTQVPVAPPTQSLSPSPWQQQPYSDRHSSPGDVVAAYFDAINAGDYDTAWALGGENISGMTPTEFANSFDTTAWDDWQPDDGSRQGNTIHGTLRALQTDATMKVFKGSYTTDGNGTIISADIRQVR